MKNLTCMICVEAYDPDRVVPLVLKSCGHTFCKPCVLRLVADQRQTKKAAIKCPKCRTIQYFYGKFENVEREFPKNFLYFESLASPSHQKQEEEPPERRAPVVVCLDPCCSERGKNPIVSAESSHPDCDKDLRADPSTFSNCDFILPQTGLEFNPVDLKERIHTKVRQLEESLNSIVDCCQRVLLNERRYIELAQGDFGFFASNINLYMVEKSGVGGRLQVTLQTHKDILSFARKTTLELDTVLREHVEGLAHDTLKHLVTRNLISFGVFNETVFLKNREVIEKMKKTHPLLLESMFLGNWKPALPFSLDDSLGVVREAYEGFGRRFCLLDSSNKTSRDNDFLASKIAKAFEGSELSFRGIETRLRLELDKNEERGRWSVSFSNSTFSRPKPPAVFWSVFSYLGFYLMAYLTPNAESKPEPDRTKKVWEPAQDYRVQFRPKTGASQNQSNQDFPDAEVWRRWFPRE